MVNANLSKFIIFQELKLIPKKFPRNKIPPRFRNFSLKIKILEYSIDRPVISY